MTPQESLDRFLALYHEGKTTRQIAEETGVSWPLTKVGISFLRALGFTLSDRRADIALIRDRHFVRTWNACNGYSDVAHKLSRSEDWVRGRVKTLRLAGFSLKEEPKVDVNALFLDVWNTSETVSEASTRLNRPIRSIASRASVLRRRGFDVKWMDSRKQPNRTKAKANREMFIEKWNASASVQDVAKAFHIKNQTASARAHELRALGLPLKEFSRGRPKGSIGLHKSRPVSDGYLLSVFRRANDISEAARMLKTTHNHAFALIKAAQERAAMQSDTPQSVAQ